MRLYLVRHGAVSPPVPGMFYGGAEVPLSAQGEAQARAAAAALAGANIDYLVFSCLSRARYGAERVAEALGLAPEQLHEEPGFREIDRGRWLGRTPEQLRAEFPGDLEAHAADPEGWTGHGGESKGQLRDRVLEARDRALRAAAAAAGPDAGVCVVSHLWPTRAMLADALGWGLERWDELEVETGSLSCIADGATAAPRVKWVGRVP